MKCFSPSENGDCGHDEGVGSIHHHLHAPWCGGSMLSKAERLQGPWSTLRNSYDFQFVYVKEGQCFQWMRASQRQSCAIFLVAHVIKEKGLRSEQKPMRPILFRCYGAWVLGAMGLQKWGQLLLNSEQGIASLQNFLHAKASVAWLSFYDFSPGCSLGQDMIL